MSSRLEAFQWIYMIHIHDSIICLHYITYMLTHAITYTRRRAGAQARMRTGAQARRYVGAQACTHTCLYSPTDLIYVSTYIHA